MQVCVSIILTCRLNIRYCLSKHIPDLTKVYSRMFVLIFFTEGVKYPLRNNENNLLKCPCALCLQVHINFIITIILENSVHGVFFFVHVVCCYF